MSSKSAVALTNIPTVASLFKQGKLVASSSSTPAYASLADRVALYQGDITTLNVDAIVNAANETLLGGGGVDGAIHRAAGPELKSECKALNGCKTGDAKITKGYNLPAKHVVHTVGPVYAKGRKEESRSALQSAYRRSLEEATKQKLQSIVSWRRDFDFVLRHANPSASQAFPSISTGVYGYPMQEATNVALDTVGRFLMDDKQLKKVIFCVFSEKDYKMYEKCIPDHFGAGQEQ